LPLFFIWSLELEHFLNWTKEKSNEVGFVYFVKVGRYTKIGRTKNPKRRMRELKVKEEDVIMIFMIPKYKSFERYCHAMFRDCRFKNDISTEYFLIDENRIYRFYKMYKNYTISISAIMGS